MRKFLIILIILLSHHIAQSQCNFKAIGHRGSSYNYPENTLISIEQAFIEGAFATEIDIRYTSDSVLVLMHDSIVDRTTDGYGEVAKLPYSYIKTLDAGSWKDNKFKGAKVPTLIDVLKLADKYHKHLYLNMKVYAPALLSKAISESGVPKDVGMFDPDQLYKIAQYHKFMPETPLVYFGAFPKPVNDDKYYQFLKDHNVMAFEVEANTIIRATNDTILMLRDMLHKYGIEMWAYTINDNGYMNTLKSFGIDGLETDRPAAAIDIFCNGGSGGYFPVHRINGQWDFDNKDLTGTIGSKLIQEGDINVPNQVVKFGKTSEFGLPFINGTDANVMMVPAFDINHYLTFYSNMAPDGNPGKLSCENHYTLIMDVLRPATSTNSYISLLKASHTNSISTDGTLFIRTSDGAIGRSSQYHGTTKPNQWYRIAFAFDLANDKIDKFIDGTLVGTTSISNALDGSCCLNNNWGVQSSLFFADNNGETDQLYLNSIQLRDYTMTAEEIGKLGTVADKIPQTILVDSLSCPVINSFSKDTTVCQGSDFTLMVNSSKSFNYNWQMNNGSGWQEISGTCFSNKGTPLLKITNAPMNINKLQLRCLVRNNCITYSIPLTIKVNSFIKPVITPNGIKTLCSNDSLKLIVENKQTYTYQWYKDNQTISKAVNSTYTAHSSGLYYVKVSDNEGCSAFSDSATVATLDTPKAIITAKSNTAKCTNDSTKLYSINRDYDSFETKNFSFNQWTNDKSKPWTIDTIAYKGKYSAKSGTTTDLVVSSISINQNVGYNDTISFCLKTSSEAGYDFLYFYINDLAVGRWSGESAWIIAKFAVKPGINNFRWSYNKDSSYSRFSDCVWIDNIIFPKSATNNDVSYQWLKNGAKINGATTSIFQAVDNGWYSLTLNNKCKNFKTDSIYIELNTKINTSIFADGSLSFCSGNSIAIYADVSKNYNYQWKKDGINIPGAISSVFTAIESGTYNVNITNNICSVSSESVTIDVKPKPDIKLGKDTTLELTDMLLLDAGKGNSFYQWNNGSMQQTILIDAAKLGIGNYVYSVLVVGSNSCVASDTIRIKIINELFTFNGSLIYNNDSKTPVKAQVFLLNPKFEIIGSVLTDLTGNFKFSKLNNGNYTITVSFLDIANGYDPLDALIVNRNYIGLDNSLNDNLKKLAADVDFDGNINPGDALLINRRYINAISDFKISDWLYDTSAITINNTDAYYTIKVICAGDVNASGNKK